MKPLQSVPFFVLALTVALVGCSPAAQAPQPNPSNQAKTATAPTKLPDGTYDVQNVSYEDASGAYEVFLLNPPAGAKPVFTSNNVQMARLTDEAIKEGKKSYLEVKDSNPLLYLTPDFKIAYIHNVTQEQTNPNTGRTETVVVRQESSFWTPFIAGMAGAAIGNALFAPRYYVPPVYGGGPMSGYGGYGNSRNQAFQGYQQRYGSLPPASRVSSSGTFGSSRPGSTSSGNLRSSGSGAGSSRLGTSAPSSQYRTTSPSRSRSFGTGRRR
ncbi:hypothetical protein [Candidatus Cyanaurora vandensis]|uniref:hypothetical protein n=1 Tax=Candidatus Cyanaurora vandensis TaxID=2714958 RepID=UPI00258062F6|nr:hypothetical protein [Candidatus Cyanaurora vandensis]